MRGSQQVGPSLPLASSLRLRAQEVLYRVRCTGTGRDRFSHWPWPWHFVRRHAAVAATVQHCQCQIAQFWLTCALVYIYFARTGLHDDEVAGGGAQALRAVASLEQLHGVAGKPFREDGRPDQRPQREGLTAERAGQSAIDSAVVFKRVCAGPNQPA